MLGQLTGWKEGWWIMNLVCLLIYIVTLLAGLLVVALLAYGLLRLFGAIHRAYLALFVRAKPDRVSQIHETRRKAQQSMDEVSKEFLDDIYQQTLRDWSRF
jgi:hypothetical protein